MRHIHMHVCVLGAHSIAGVFSPLQNLIVLNIPNNAMASIVLPNGISMRVHHAVYPCVVWIFPCMCVCVFVQVSDCVIFGILLIVA